MDEPQVDLGDALAQAPQTQDVAPDVPDEKEDSGVAEEPVLGQAQVEGDVPFEEPQETTQEPATGKGIPPEKTAELICQMMDTSQHLIFGQILRYKRNKLYKGQEIKLAEIEQTIEEGSKPSPEDVRFLARFHRFSEIINDLKFKPDEEEDVVTVLTEYCRRNNVQVPVDFALIITLSEIVIDRGLKVWNA